MHENAWDELIEALTLLRRSHPEVIRPFNCAHDTLWVSADPADFTPEELTRLNTIGFFPSDDGVPGFMSFRFGSA